MVTHTSHRATSRRTALHALLGGAVAAVVVALAACGDGDGAADTVTSPAQRSLVAAAQKSAAASFRFEVRLSAGPDAPTDAVSAGEAAPEPAMVGTSAGGWVHTSMDVGAGMEAFAEAIGDDGSPMPAPGDVVFETITDGEVLYMHWPRLAQADERPARPDETPADRAAREALAAMGEGWGRIEIDGRTPRAVEQIAGTSLIDPHLYLDLVAGGRNAESRGSEQIDGVQTLRLRADVTFEDLVALEGFDSRSELEESFAEFVDGEELDALVDEILAIESAVEVWVDDDEHVRRVVTTIDMRAFYDVVRDRVDVDGADPDEIGSITTTLDMFDHDDPTVSTAPPATWTDVTDALAHVLGEDGS
jgi:hypothetical protein